MQRSRSFCSFRHRHKRICSRDPSFEQPKDKDQFGLVFAKWGGWKYEGDCEFAVGRVAHSGRSSCLLVGRSEPKIRVVQLRDLEPGRYRMTAYIRGLDIGVGVWNQTTEFMFDGKYIPLRQERDLRVDQAHLCWGDQGKETGRPFLRTHGARLFLD